MLTALLLANSAFAADLHVALSTRDWSDEFVHAAGEPFTGRSEMITQGKKEVVFEVVWSPAPHSVVDDGYQMEVTICRVWAKGKKRDRDCVTENIIAHPESAEHERKAAEVKMSDKWSYQMEAWATGEMPSTEMPMETEEPADAEEAAG